MFIFNCLKSIKRNKKALLVKEKGFKWIVKNYRNGIWCLVYKLWSPKWLRARTLNKEWMRFFSASGYEWDWIYMHELDETKDYIIVVEWLIDFLTLRQYDTNVIWLVTALVWYDDIKELSNKYKIIICPDNDESWYQWLEQLKWYDYSLFNVWAYWDYKDIWDFYQEHKSVDIIDVIKENAKEILPINTTFDWLDMMLKTISERWQLGIDWPLDDIYKKCSWVIAWKVYTIWAYSNIWKSKIAYYHAQYFLKQWLKVLFVNLEVSAEFCLAEIVNSYYNSKWEEEWKWFNKDRSKFRNLIIRDDLFELESILRTIESSKCDICIIDFVQNIQVKWSKWYEKNAEIAIWLQRTAIKTWTTIYNLSQVANQTAKDIWNWSDTIISLKWAWEYTASSDVIFILKKWEQEWQIDLVVEKNKFGRNKLEFKLKVDYQRNQFEVIKPFEKPF